MIMGAFSAAALCCWSGGTAIASASEEDNFACVSPAEAEVRVGWLEARPTPATMEMIIHGRLLDEENAERRETEDMPEVVRLVVARAGQPGPVDWRIALKTALVVECSADRDGTIEAHADLRRLHFRVGIETLSVALADTDVNGVDGKPVRSRDLRILPGTECMLPISCPESISEGARRIAELAGTGGRAYNGVALIRTVNFLHSQEKEGAIDALREYLALASYCPGHMPEPPGFWLDVFWIIRLLFESDDDIAPPPTRLGGPAVRIRSGSESLFPHYPLVEFQDLPLLFTGGGMMLFGAPSEPYPILAWAEKHGRLRQEPLHPPDDPLETVDAWLARRDVQAAFTDHNGLKWQARRQALAAIEDLVTEGSLSGCRTEADWVALRQLVNGLDIEWEEQQQAYVTGAAASNSP
ncbi:MAG: hypothetical protein IH988_05600 [Planctomycetes bacterium]|nr:hypothetical protein [Planctomycetota bacterium]